MVALLPTTKGVVGLAFQNTPDGVSLATELLSPLHSIDPTQWNLASVVNYEETIGQLSLYQLPDGSGVRVTVIPTFPADYDYLYFVLRSKYKYTRNTTEVEYSVVIANNSHNPVEVSVVDTDIADSDVNEHYYYSLLALISSGPDNPPHFQYNPNTGFASAYRYDVGTLKQFLLDRLPAEWHQRDDDFLDRFIEIFSSIFDTIKSDINVYLRDGKDIDTAEEKYLHNLGSLIGWGVNEELDEITQRIELANAVNLYQKKGRDASIEFLIQLITGWELAFEHGYRRICKADGSCSVFNPNDLDFISKIGHPEFYVERQQIAVSDGLASQDYPLFNGSARDITVELYNGTDYTTWLEVDDFSGSSATAQHYVISEVSNISTVTFGDGANGAIPPATEVVYASYFYSGDEAKYLPTGTDDWKNSVGTRVLLTTTPTSSALTKILLDKLLKVIRLFKASYAIYKVLVYTIETESCPPATESYSDVYHYITPIQMNQLNHNMNDDDYRTPALAA